MSRAAAGALAAVLALASAPASAGTTLGASHEAEHLNTGGTWGRSVLSIERRGSQHRVLVVELRSIDRFEARDEEFALAGHAPVTDDVGLTIDFSAAPEPLIVAEFSTKIDIDIKLPHGLVGHLIGRRANYPEDNATGFGAGIEYYFGAWRLAYEAITTSLEGGDSGTAHVVRGDWYYGDENRVGVSGATGDEATRVSPTDVIVTDVSSAALSGRHWLTPRWGANWALTWAEQGDYHTRTGGSLGILYRF